MKAVSKVGLLAAVALLATAAVATSAQAQGFQPDNTAVSGLSDNFNLTYGAASVDCDTARVDGTTNGGLLPLALSFADCAVSGVGAAEVNCVGEVTLVPDSAPDDTATGELTDGFQCDATTAVCTITVEGPQTTQGNWALDEANDVLSADMEVQASRTGSLLCGPGEGTAPFTADYATTPANLTIDP